MLKRKIEAAFSQWKNRSVRNPLVVKGCRQCGKTSSVLAFAERNYKHVIRIDFYQNPAYRSIFEGSLSVDDIIMKMTAFLGSAAAFEAGNTVIVLDEIQECPEARTALKFFQLDGRFDVICTGSLLGISGYGQPKSVPVGYETIIDMRPMDFEEFLWANGIAEETIAYLRGCIETATPVETALHLRFRELFLQYAIVGGMPRAVQLFADTKRLNEVLEIQRGIIRDYRDDMLKYAPDSDKSKIVECFDSIPAQLAKENKKFMYSAVRKKGSASKFEGSLQWIEDAGIISRCYNLNALELPLEGNADKSCFKVYMNDTGLFVSMLEDGTQSDILTGNLNIYKGALYEALAADCFVKAGRRLYYYKKDSGLEIDFAIRRNNKCVPVEVKAATGNAKSLKTVAAHEEKYHVSQALKLGDYNIGSSGKITTMPLYAAAFL
ncbi:MAG: ATP-binding protein [Synergistaceae bacterium]|nr:ATP-binding protein [Candidatus Equadaptatus faecalis]